MSFEEQWSCRLADFIIEFTTKYKVAIQEAEEYMI